MRRLAVFGPTLVTLPLSEYLAVIGYDVSNHPAGELDRFSQQQRTDAVQTAPPAELIILDLPASDPERLNALRALRELRHNGIPGVLLLDGLDEPQRGGHEPELQGSAAAVLPKPLHFGSLAAVCSRVLGTPD